MLDVSNTKVLRDSQPVAISLDTVYLKSGIMEVQDREGRQSRVQMVPRSRGNDGTHLGALQNMEKEVAGGADRPVRTQKRGRQGDDGHAGDAADVGEVDRIGEGRRGFTTLLQPLSVISIVHSLEGYDKAEARAKEIENDNPDAARLSLVE
ncbi:hypothetical protein BDZ91DRAFT_765651 [Kalaharituber pfeilii]|nr:hypothetical protein BDZ91DRAFT_765651 [Kalaharituber pfeilii]